MSRLSCADASGPVPIERATWSATDQATCDASHGRPPFSDQFSRQILFPDARHVATDQRDLHVSQ